MKRRTTTVENLHDCLAKTGLQFRVGGFGRVAEVLALGDSAAKRMANAFSLQDAAVTAGFPLLLRCDGRDWFRVDLQLDRSSKQAEDDFVAQRRAAIAATAN